MKNILHLIGVMCLGFLLPSANGQVKKATPDKVRTLIRQLSDPNEERSEAAAVALERIGDEALDELLEAFGKGDKKARPLVARVLGHVRIYAFKRKQNKLGESIEKCFLNHCEIRTSALCTPHLTLSRQKNQAPRKQFHILSRS